VSLIEAQAAAVPVVGTAVGGVASAVKDGETGFLGPAEDEAALADAVARILDDPVLAGELARAGRKHALGSFGLERLVDDLDAVYRRLPIHR
jgi:glycosyltransferase involved in cell wall biosynthesis